MPVEQNKVVTGFSHDQALQALEENLWSLWSNFGRGPGCHLYDEDGALWFDTPIRTLPYHGLLRFTGTDNLDPRIDRIVSHFRDQDVPFMWVLHPTSPSEIEQQLQARGLQEAEVITGMAADLSQLPEPTSAPVGYEIREVTTVADVCRTVELIAWRWHVPEQAKAYLLAMTAPFLVGEADSKTRVWAAFRDGEVVSKVVTHHGSMGEVGLHGVATCEEARGLGLARTLTLTALQAARQANYRIGVLHSSAMAQSLYRKIGFRDMAVIKIYASDELHI